VCDAKPILRRHLIAFLLDLYLVHRQLHPLARGFGGRNSSTSVPAMLVILDDFVFGSTSSDVSNGFCAARSSPFWFVQVIKVEVAQCHRPLTLYHHCVSERPDGPLPSRVKAEVTARPCHVRFARADVISVPGHVREVPIEESGSRYDGPTD
jgi:hypothetical protein